MIDKWSDALEAEVLAQELLQYAARLRARAKAIPLEQECTPTCSHPWLKATRNYAELARKVYRARRLREKFLPSELLGEPVWDMLLDLYIAALEGRQISVTSACAASAVPQTTALRWLSLMEDRGFTRRREAKHDKRVHFVEITTEGARHMQNYLSRVDSELLNDDTSVMFAIHK